LIERGGSLPGRSVIRTKSNFTIKEKKKRQQKDSFHPNGLKTTTESLGGGNLAWGRKKEKRRGVMSQKRKRDHHTNDPRGGK